MYPVSTDGDVGARDNSNCNISFKHLSIIFLSHLRSSDGEVDLEANQTCASAVDTELSFCSNQIKFSHNHGKLYVIV